MRLQRLYLQAELRAKPFVIVVQERHQLARGRHHAGVVCPGRPRGPIVRDDPKLTVSGNHDRRLEGLFAIEDHDAFHGARVILGEHAPDRRGHQLVAVVGRDDHGDRRPLDLSRRRLGFVAGDGALT